MEARGLPDGDEGRLQRQDVDEVLAANQVDETESEVAEIFA